MYNPNLAPETRVKITLLPRQDYVYWHMNPEEKRAAFLHEIPEFHGYEEGTLIVEQEDGLDITMLALEVTEGNLVTLPAVPLDGFGF